MKLISTGKTKRQIALMFVFAFTLSNILALIGPSAKAAVTVSSPTAGICFQHTGSTLNGALPTVYSIGTIQISLTAAEIVPGDDAAGTTTLNTAAARATGDPTDSTKVGAISGAGDVIGNVFTIVPPTGSNFVIVPGFQNTAAGSSNLLATANASIVNAVGNDGTADSNVAISVGVVTQGTAGVGRAIVALAKDASDTYPKTATGTNSVTISINGLGIIIPPTSDATLSGTLQATFDSTPPSGIGVSGGSGSPAVAAAIPGLSGTLNLCTLTSVAGQLEAVVDADDGTNDLYDKTAASPNLLAISQIAANTTINVFDQATTASTGALDLEPVVIRGLAGTGSSTRDQVISTAELLVDITGTGTNFTPATSGLDLNNFGNTNTSPITVTFGPKNSSSATVTLDAVDIIIGSAAAGGTAAGFNVAQSSRHGFLGALRAASLDSGNATTISDFLGGTLWGIASVRGDTAVVQETNLASVSGTGVRDLAGIAVNADPGTNTFLDLRINCNGTAPVAGWFAIANSSATALPFGTTTAAPNQLVKASASGTKFNVSSLGNFYTQALTNIAGTAFSTAFGAPFKGGAKGAAADTFQSNNALLYASCSGMSVTIIPIQNGFDATKDVLAVVPKFSITNVTNAFTSDIELIATVTGNNLTGSTELSLAKVLGAITSSGGATSTLAAASGVALSETGQLGISCSSGSTAALNLSSVSGATLDSQVTAACTSGSIATPPALFVGGTASSISGSTVIDGTPVVQGEGRGVLIKELTSTGFSELAAKVGGGTTGTVIEVQLPTGCDVIDDRDDNNTTATSATTAPLGGNDVTMVTITSTAGISVSPIGGDATVAVGTSPANITDSTTIVPASGSDPALIHFLFTKATGSSSATEFDSTTTDGILVKLDAQDIFCPSTVSGNLTGLVRAQNKTASPTITENLGTVSFGTATKAADFSVAPHTATSTKGETSTNSNLGATVRLAGGSTTTAHPFQIVELNERSFAIGGRVSARNIDPTSNSSTVITRGQIWVTPSAGSVFATAPGSSDVTFSDTTLQIDGAPYIATATLDANAPLGTLVIGIKKGASGDPSTVASTITVNNLILATASTGAADLAASVQFFSQDAGATVNTPGAVAGNSASTPTLFTPYKPGAITTTKAGTQLNQAAVQVGTGALALPQVTSRLTTLGGPQINPFATLVTSAKNADAAKITVAATAVAASSSGSTTTDNTVTVTGAAGSVDGGSQVTVTSGSSSTYDSVTVFASSDGSFTAKLRGDCASPNTSVTVTVTEKLSGTSTTAVTKTALCGGSSGQTAQDVFNEIAGSDGVATITEVLAYITSKGGLSAVISAGGATLDGVILAAKSALGLS
jgi:hypothetical protein